MPDCGRPALWRTQARILASLAVALKVTGMFWKLLGILLGAGIAVGPLEWGREPAARVAEILFQATADGLDTALSAAGLSTSSTVYQVVTLLVGVCIPGLVALGLVAVTGLADAGRRTVGAVLTIAAVALLGVYGQVAIPAAGLLLAASALLATATGLLLIVPITALSVVIAVAHARLVMAGPEISPVGGIAAELAALTGAGDPSLWRLVLLATALMPIGYAASTVLGARRIVG